MDIPESLLIHDRNAKVISSQVCGVGEEKFAGEEDVVGEDDVIG